VHERRGRDPAAEAMAANQANAGASCLLAQR
jgi:hypothetical protein